MKIVFITTIVLALAIQLSAQCTVEIAAKHPYSCVDSKSYIYIGTQGKENKANTEIMYKKLVKIFEVFNSAFKQYTGMEGLWRARVDNISNEGLVKGVIEIGLHPVTCKENGEFNKNSWESSFSISVYINSFVPYLTKDIKKQPGFILDQNKPDTLNGQIIYYITKEQEEEKFNGFPLYYYNWDNSRNASVIITKPSVPFLKAVTTGVFLGLFKKWTSAYNAAWKADPRYTASPEDIDKFIGQRTKEFLNKPMICIWPGGEQAVYLKRSSYANDVTQGNQWVTIDPDYINKRLPETSIQFISILFNRDRGGQDRVTAKMMKDFKTNFDFKKLQDMLEK
ncbi:MAG: hypothetical protein ABIP35_07930 [Ginsengibacter sp.]